ncbi:hypothetical protein H2248_002125 [Termitomyces sp. 'cryptogamus']|nr:hypothetical protein H2248_002125 [Termitomyces sp. 'cryptogamus']
MDSLNKSALSAPSEHNNDLEELDLIDPNPAHMPNHNDHATQPELNAEQQGPQRLTCIQQPTEKAAMEGEQLQTRLEKTMEEVKESGRRVREQRAERNKTETSVTQVNNNSQTQAQTKEQAPTNDTQVPAPTNINPNIDHDQVLAAIQQFSNLEPLEMGIEEEPKTWKEAQNGLSKVGGSI